MLLLVLFIIVKESGVSAGVRRIEAVCGNAAYNHFKAQRHTLELAQASVKNLDLLSGVERLKEQVKSLKVELQDAQNASKEEVSSEDINGVALVVEEINSGDIKERIDELKNANESVAVMLFQVKGDKVLIAAGVKNAPLKAGDWIKKVAPILGGGGGGRPDFAQAGGKDVSKVGEGKELAHSFAVEALS